MKTMVSVHVEPDRPERGNLHFDEATEVAEALSYPSRRMATMVREKFDNAIEASDASARIFRMPYRQWP